VKATEEVTDYRTKVSGIRPKDIENGEDFKTVSILSINNICFIILTAILFIIGSKGSCRASERSRSYRSCTKP